MAAVPIHARRGITGVCALLIAVCLSVAATPTHAPPSKTSADSLRDISEKLFFAGQYDSLREVASAFVRRAEASGDSVLLGRAITQRGRALMMLGGPAGARDVDIGIRIAESLRDTVGLMPAVNFKGFGYLGAGRYQEAVQCFERRLVLAQKTRLPIDEAWARVSLGFAFHALGEQKRAREQYVRTLELSRASGHRELEINALLGLGRVEGADGNGPAAIRWYQQAWVASHEVGDRMNEMWALNNLSTMEATQGDLSRSWEYLHRAIGLSRELKSPDAMVVPALNLFSRLVELGDFETAESVLKETRTLCETQGATSHIETIDYHLAVLRMSQGRYATATAMMRKLAANPGAMEMQHQDAVFIDLALALASNDSLDAAIDVLSSRLKKRGPGFYGDNLSRASLVLGRLYRDAGKNVEALDWARRTRATSIPAGEKRMMVAAMFLESMCLRDLGDRAHATTTFYAALDSLTGVRTGISTPQWREVYGQWVAQDVIESGRVLLEYSESSTRTERERAFFDAIQRVKSRALLDRIGRPRSAGDEPRLPNRVTTLTEMQANLQPGEAVLDFAVGTQRSFLAAVTADSLRLIELPGPGSDLTERVQLLRTVLASTDPALRAEYDADRLREVQRGLGRDILGGVDDVIGRATRVFVCPDGYFAAVPFGLLILPNGSDVLMKDRDVLQVPSASVLVLERTTHQADTAASHRVVAISTSARDLSGARAEVNHLARHYRDVNHLSDLNNVDEFADAAHRAGTLHIASHALLVDRSPWWSGIELRENKTAAPDTAHVSRKKSTTVRAGFLSDVDSLTIERTFPSDPYVRAWQIADLDIPARLAVLSACETAGGRMTTGEGTLGLTAAFLSAGVPVVVSSLWPVDDRVTAVIMRSFYSNLSAGEPVATALRHAQLDASHTARYAHPFYWSGFTVVGDGARKIPIEKRLFTWSPVLSGVAGLLFLGATGLFIHRRRARAAVA